MNFLNSKTKKLNSKVDLINFTFGDEFIFRNENQVADTYKFKLKPNNEYLNLNL